MSILPYKKLNVHLITLTVTFSIEPLKYKAAHNVVIFYVNLFIHMLHI